MDLKKRRIHVRSRIRRDQDRRNAKAGRPGQIAGQVVDKDRLFRAAAAFPKCIPYPRFRRSGERIDDTT